MTQIQDSERVLIERNSAVMEVTYKVFRTIFSKQGWKMRITGNEIIVNKPDIKDLPDPNQEPEKEPEKEPETDPNVWTMERYKKAILKKPDLIAELNTLAVEFRNSDLIENLRALLYDTLLERKLLPEGAERYDK